MAYAATFRVSIGWTVNSIVQKNDNKITDIYIRPRGQLPQYMIIAVGSVIFVILAVA